MADADMPVASKARIRADLESRAGEVLRGGVAIRGIVSPAVVARQRVDPNRSRTGDPFKGAAYLEASTLCAEQLALGSSGERVNPGESRMSPSEPSPIDDAAVPLRRHQASASEATMSPDPIPGSYVLNVHRLKRGMASLEPLAELFFLLSDGRTMIYHQLRKVGEKRVQIELRPCEPEAPLFSVKFVDQLLADLKRLPDDWRVVLPEGMTFRTECTAVVWPIAVAQSRAEVMRVEAVKRAEA